MKSTSLIALVVGSTFAAIAIPGVALGNAKRVNGSLAADRQAQTPYLATLTGAAEVPPADPDGTGAAAISLSMTSDTGAEICWDINYTAIDAPTAAHLHKGAVGTNGPVSANFGTPGATSATGCTTITATLAEEIIATPAGFYVNIHNATYPGGALRGQLAKGPEPSGAQILLPTPLRAYDSRVAPATKFAAATTRTISLANGKTGANVTAIAVPPGATGAMVTVTVASTEAGGGFLTLYSAAVTTEPSTSTLNWTEAGQDVATTTVVAVDSTGQVKVKVSGAAHVIVDVIGFIY